MLLCWVEGDPNELSTVSRVIVQSETEMAQGATGYLHCLYPKLLFFREEN